MCVWLPFGARRPLLPRAARTAGRRRLKFGHRVGDVAGTIPVKEWGRWGARRARGASRKNAVKVGIPHCFNTGEIGGEIREDG